MPKGYSNGVAHKPPHNGFVPPPPPHRPVIVPVGPSIAYVPLTKDQFALVDSEDAAWLDQWNWHAKWYPNTRSYRAARVEYAPDGTGVTFTMHSALLGLHGRAVNADHIDPHNTLDNRRCNLRPANVSEQAANKRRYRSNTSGYKGVSKAPNRPGWWQARIGVGGKRLFLGAYPTPEAAFEAYKKAAVIHHGEFAKLQ